MTTPAGSGLWDFNPAGYPTGAVTFTGTILFPAGIDPATTQTAMMVLGPSGGQINVPPLAAGQPGPPPEFRNVTVNPVPFGQALPSPSAQLISVSPGGPGVPSIYDLILYINEGPQGTPGQSGTINGASDVPTTAPPNGGTLMWDEATNAWNWVTSGMPGGISGTGGTTASSNQTTRTLQTIACGPYDYDVFPSVSGQCIISGTPNVSVNLTATLGSAGGTVVATGWGIGGQSQFAVSLVPDFLNYTNAVIKKGQTATIYINATQTDSSGNSWSTAEATCNFNVQPIWSIM